MQPENSPPAPRRFDPALILLVVVAVSVRIAAAAYWQSRADAEGVLFRFGDSYSYWDAARAAFDGRPAAEVLRLESQIFRVPGYPSFLQLAARLQPESLAVLAARFLGCLLGAYCVCFVYDAARRLAGRTAAIIAGSLAAVYPGAVGMSVFVLSEALFCPLMLLNLRAAESLVGLLPLRGGNPAGEAAWGRFAREGLAAGVLAGFAVLTKPVWILWPGGFIVYLAMLACFGFSSRVLARRISVAAVSIVLGFVAVMTPWWLHTYRLTGHFVPTTLQVGATLYDSLHEGASGGSDEDMKFVERFAAELKAEGKTAGTEQARKNSEQAGTAKAAQDVAPAGAFSYELDRRLKLAAVRWAAENPSDVLRLSLIKFARTWAPLPRAAQVGNAAIRWAEAICYVVVAALAAAGLAAAGRRGVAAVYALPLGYFAVIHMVFVGSVRYRQPAILAACVLAGIGGAWVMVLWRERKRPEAMTENGGRR